MAAGLLYSMTPADFVVSPGALADVVEEDSGNPGTYIPVDAGNVQGWAALLPSFAGSYDVYDTPGGTQITELYASDGTTPIDVVEFAGTFETLGGTLAAFYGPDTHEGDVYLTQTGGDASVWVRVAPSTDPLWSRMADAEEALTILDGKNVPTFSDTAPDTGQTLVWSSDHGRWVPSPAAGTGTVTSVAEVGPDDGNVPAAALLSALGLTGVADAVTVFKQRGYVGLAWTGAGYEAKPSGISLSIRRGPQQPTSQLAEGDIWLQPEGS